MPGTHPTKPAPPHPGGANALRRGAVRGASLALAAQGAKTLLDAAAQFILLALIAPSHLGVFAFAQALTGFVSCFGDLAGQKFLVRRRALEPRVVATVYWMELALGATVAAAWAIVAPTVLAGFGHADQAPFAQALALWIVLERLLLPKAVLDQRMAFGRSNGALLAATAIGSVVLLASAALGAGPWSLVLGLLARTLASGAVLTLAARFHPLRAFDPAVARELLVFGAPLLLSTALTFAYTNVDYLVVGQMLGFTALGLYTAAYRYPHYLMQFSTILSSVILSSFSKTADNEHLARGLRLLTRYAAALAFIFPAAMWVEGEWLIQTLLPGRWWSALFAFQVFTTLAALRLALVHWGQVFVTRGETRPLMLVGLVNLPLVTLGAWGGVKLAGLEGAALGVAAAAGTTLLACCALLLKPRLPRFSYGEALSPVLKALLAFFLAALATRAITTPAPWAPGAGLLAGCVAYGAALLALCGGEARRVFGRGAR